MSPQLSCSDICQIWMWFKESNMSCCMIENFPNGDIKEQSFSTPHLWIENILLDQKDEAWDKICTHICIWILSDSLFELYQNKSILFYLYLIENGLFAFVSLGKGVFDPSWRKIDKKISPNLINKHLFCAVYIERTPGNFFLLHK